jgi:hypothetical protein
MYDELKGTVQNYEAPFAPPVSLDHATSAMHLRFVEELRFEQVPVFGTRLSWGRV